MTTTKNRISAAELRSLGWNIPESIPDCATIPSHALVPVPEDFTVTQDATDSKMFHFGLNAVLTAPFEWVEGTYTIIDKKAD